MEVELDVQVAPERTWRQAARDLWRDWAAFWCRVWRCQQSKLFKDEPMTPADWERHLSWRRHCIEPRVFVRVVRALSMIELWVVFVSVAAGLYAEHLQQLPGWPRATSKDYIIVFSLTSFALALLMVFRTNTAHARWWEARTAAGRWLNCVRNSQRMLLNWAGPEDATAVREYTRWNACLTAAACAYLCRKDSYWEHCEGILTPDEVSYLMSCANAPVEVLTAMSGLVKRTSLSVWERAEVEREISAFDISLGALERISRQAIPMAYTRHTSRFIIAYLTFLPFALWDYTRWLTPFVMAALTFLLVGIENIGVQIENPMLVLPMHRFCVGNRMAALSLAQNHARVTDVMEAGLAAARAGGGPAGGPAGGAAAGKGGAAAAGAPAGAAVVTVAAAPPAAPPAMER
ncbi:MAG: Bestrophin, RFP-TM, chloride channel-domain-containing protein [Monoraphidium minutum]|nr:MAG: Bestrophin, RFP-TM, chloride channel-domain-containing protein [Monoraphidium minutum]